MPYMRFGRIPCALAALGAMLAGGADAAAETRRVPADFPTINAALAQSDSGDVLLVGPGVYAESIVLTDGRGDGVLVESIEGPETTMISYGEAADPNEAVVTFQRCSEATALRGFTIDGRDVARRGVLVNSNSRPALSNLLIRDCEYGVASYRGSVPILETVRILSSRTAGLFVQDGSADVRGAEITDGEKLGVYVHGTQDTLHLRDVTVARNGGAGLQITEGDLLVQGGTFAANGEAGLILRDVSPVLQGVLVEDHANVGIVLERCGGVLSDCTVRANRYGVVVAIGGAPRIRRCTFLENMSYHVGVEGDAEPVIGGSLVDANRFAGGVCALASSSARPVVATHNDWGEPCPRTETFRRTGTGEVVTAPWAVGEPLRAVESCEDAAAPPPAGE